MSLREREPQRSKWVAGLSTRWIAGGVVLVGNILVRVQVPVKAVFKPVPSSFLEEGVLESVPRKWRNGTGRSVDKIKGDDKASPPAEGSDGAEGA